MTTLSISRVVNGGTVLHFQWEGGNYIEIIYDGSARDVINVWDYETDKPTIPFTRTGLGAAADRWIRSYNQEGYSLADVIKNWGY